jgi:hypothetical protein
MATRARIGIQTKSGRIIASYQHWDGYPGGLGYTLCEYWNNPKKVTEGIKLGNASKWGMFIGDEIDFDNREAETYNYQNVYYMRDRGEKDQQHKSYQDEATYLKEGWNSGEDYIYLMKDVGEKDFLGKPVGTWFYAKYDSSEFKPLEADAVKEHIHILQESYKLNKGVA